MGFILIIVTVLFSYAGFRSGSFFNRYEFEIDKILIYREYKRLISSGFLHVGWPHLILNMFSLYAFYGSVESDLGGVFFLLVYFTSLVGGNLFALYIHRNHGDYRAVGASGAVSGIIFAAIALFPGIGIGFFGFPLSIPGWLYGILYVLYTIFGIKSKKDSIGHEAHLGGAIMGMTVALLIRPAAFPENYPTILIIILPTLVFLYLIITKPQILLIGKFSLKPSSQHYSIDHKYNEEKTNSEKEIDRILDKINKHGINSLTAKEKLRLKQYSKSPR